MIPLFSRKQTSIALSSEKSEYMANTSSCEAIWILKSLAELTESTLNAIVIYYDTQSSTKLSEKSVFNDLCYQIHHCQQLGPRIPRSDTNPDPAPHWDPPCKHL